MLESVDICCAAITSNNNITDKNWNSLCNIFLDKLRNVCRRKCNRQRMRTCTCSFSSVIVSPLSICKQIRCLTNTSNAHAVISKIVENATYSNAVDRRHNITALNTVLINFLTQINYTHAGKHTHRDDREPQLPNCQLPTDFDN